MRHCPLSYRGHSTLPYLIPAYIIHRISLHELCIINTHTCSLFERCSPDLFVLVTCEETLLAFLPINISVWAGSDSSPGWQWLTWSYTLWAWVMFTYNSQNYRDCTVTWLTPDSTRSHAHTESRSPPCVSYPLPVPLWPEGPLLLLLVWWVPLTSGTRHTPSSTYLPPNTFTRKRAPQRETVGRGDAIEVIPTPSVWVNKNSNEAQCKVGGRFTHLGNCGSFNGS